MTTTSVFNSIRSSTVALNQGQQRKSKKCYRFFSTTIAQVMNSTMNSTISSILPQEQKQKSHETSILIILIVRQSLAVITHRYYYGARDTETTTMAVKATDLYRCWIVVWSQKKRTAVRATGISRTGVCPPSCLALHSQNNANAFLEWQSSVQWHPPRFRWIGAWRPIPGLFTITPPVRCNSTQHAGHPTAARNGPFLIRPTPLDLLIPSQ